MTRPKRNDDTIKLTKQELLRVLSEDDALKKLMQTLLQEVLEAEMDEALQAGKGDVRPARAPQWPLHALAGDARRQARAAGAAGSARPFLERVFRALPAQREGAGGGPDGVYVQGVSTRRVK